jgi:translation elongation factor EF-G
MSLERRLLNLEIQDIRAEVAAATPEGITVDQMLEAIIAFLQSPVDQQQQQYPGYPDAEWEDLWARLPLYRLARQASTKGRR